MNATVTQGYLRVVTTLPSGESIVVELHDDAPSSIAQALDLIADEMRFRAAPQGSPLKQDLKHAGM